MDVGSDNFSAHMPSSNNVPWTSEQMPWSNSTYTGVMRFTANLDYKSLNQKRKSNMEQIYPSKQHITEEKMAATLNSLHISNNFIAHNSNVSTERRQSDNHVENVMESDIEPKCPFYSSKDLEKKLRNAKHITICEELKNIKNSETIIPKALLERYERPCQALVIWQPPLNVKSLVPITNSVSTSNEKYEMKEDEHKIPPNLKYSTTELNNYTMETDM
ncbi:uncharacterized protein LOC129616246 isoform X2 [Condylostylus longicornis]|uniref:uncharacterized protein LOC129616246 isoform X2 n=1 Tax=Condylostylus longicornis TaxID=2530218 RepID=UPI00244DEBB1|nr:uncharacterized protein LOC129616246 isoform X2 [Condylostylus longicornis]